MSWKLDGDEIQRLREEKGITREVFAKKMQRSVRTIERWETGYGLRVPHSKLLEIQKFLGVESLKAIAARNESKSKAARREAAVSERPTPVVDTPSATRERAAPKTVPRPGSIHPRLASGARDWSGWTQDRHFLSELERLVSVEKKAGVDRPPLDRWESGDYPVLTACALWDIHSAHGIHESELYSITGQVLNQRRMNQPEATALSCRGGKGGRFQLVRQIADDPNPLALTVFVNNPAHTKHLQQILHNPEPVELRFLVQVLVVVDDDPDFPGTLAVTNPVGGKRVRCPPDWKGFFVFDEEKTTEWGLLVDRIMTGSTDGAEGAPKKRAPSTPSKK